MSEEYSDEFGDGSGYDLCGPRTYKLYEDVNQVPVVPTFARLIDHRGPSFIIESTDVSEIGFHQMYLEVYLDDYNGIQKYLPFTI